MKRSPMTGVAGALLVVLGGSAMLGWGLQLATLLPTLPNLAPMVFSAALCFTLAGTALLWPPSATLGHAKFMTMCGGLIAAVAALVTAEHLMQANLGIDWVSLHASREDTNPNPGRMAAAAAVAFLLSGVVLILVSRVRRAWQATVVRALALTAGTIGALGLVGHLISAHLLFPQYQYVDIGPSTAAGLLLLAFGLRSYWRRFDWGRAPFFTRVDDRITFLSATVLGAVALGAVVATFSILQATIEAQVRDSILASLRNRSDVFQDLIRLRELNAQSAALRPAAARNLRVIRAGSDDGSNLANLNAVVDSFLRLEFSAIAYFDQDGSLVAGGGSFVRAPAISVPLATRAGAELMWHDGLLLRHRFPMHDAGGKVGEVMIEQPLPILTRMVRAPAGSGATWDMGLCVQRDLQLHCFPQRLNSRVFTTPLVNVAGELLPMTRALRGENGTTISRDYRAQNVLAAYGPVGDFGLGMVVKVDTAEVFAPIREQLLLAIGVLLAVVAAGAWLLRTRVRPLATKMQGELEERAAGLHRAQQVAKLAHVITRQDGVFDTWSETLSQLIGVEPPKVPRDTRAWLQLLHPEDRALFRRTAKEADVTGLRAEIGYRLQRSNGAWIHVQQTMEPLSEESRNGGSPRWFNTLQDVSERKLAEAKIGHLNRVYAVLSGINSMIVRVRDRNELFREACCIAVEAGGFKLAWIGLVDPATAEIEVVSWHGAGDGYIELMPLGKGRNALGQRNLSVQAITQRKAAISIDMTQDPNILLQKESRERGFHSLAILPLLAAGEAIGVLALYAGEVGFFDDEEVSLLEELAADIAFAVEHLDLDLRVKQSIAELSESERRYSDLLGNVQLLSVMLDREARITYCNEYLLALTGWRLEEVIGRSWVELFIPPESGGLKDRLAVLFSERPEGRHGDNEILTRSGERRLVRWNNSVLRSGAGEVIGLASIGEDITERKRAEREIQELNVSLERRVAERTMQLEAANKELEAFSYSVSHDLRAPLRHIDGFAQMLRDDCAPALDASGRHHLDVITESVKQMGQLIDDLLLFSKMGRVEMHQAQVSMDALVAETMKMQEGDTRGRNIEWTIEPLPDVRGDRSMLRQVWTNLLSNSVKYTRTRPLAKVRIGYSTATGEFHVQDNGVGFDMAYAGKLFGVFQRLHRAEEFEGTGVGLANVRRIIARHGGQIRAEGKLNEGATFYFSVPIHEGSH